MKPTLLILFLLGPLFGMAQTNFPNWDQFRSDRFGFTMKYPDQWDVNEESSGVYSFKNPYERLGTFTIRMDDRGDSTNAISDLERIADDNKGGSLNTIGNRQVYMYKTMSVREGNTVEIHNWIFRHGNYLIYCSYSFDSALMHAPNLVDEMKLAYQTVESMNFIP